MWKASPKVQRLIIESQINLQKYGPNEFAEKLEIKIVIRQLFII